MTIFPEPSRVILAALVTGLVLMVPNHPQALAPQVLLTFPLEWPLLLGGLALVPPGSRMNVPIRFAITTVLSLVTLQKLADFAAFTAFSRGFNVVVDWTLIDAGARLLTGTLGDALAGLAALGAALAVVVLLLALWWATGALLGRGRRMPLVTASVAVLSLAAVGADLGARRLGWASPVSLPGEAFSSRVVVERIAEGRQALADLAAFRQAALEDPYADDGPWLSTLAGRDVLVVFVESYGRASLEGPRYAPMHRRTLQAAEASLMARGLAARSGWLTAPIVGGRSWLSHATLAYGLTIPDQTRYAAALASDRRTLYDIAAGAGFRTAAVMPAITLAWPESAALGFADVFDAKGLGYRGAPFNWVTMPDQFTLDALDRRVLDIAAGPPVFGQVALISSHAPWTPIPPLLAWEDVGDGSVFSRWAQMGDPPEVVWRDQDRVRTQYRAAIDYALRAALGWVVRRADDPPLVVLLGDHQPAPFVSESESRDVPVHLIGPPDLVAAAADWDWTPGLLPAADAPVWPMASFRDRFLEAFSFGRSAAVQ